MVCVVPHFVQVHTQGDRRPMADDAGCIEAAAHIVRQAEDEGEQKGRDPGGCGRQAHKRMRLADRWDDTQGRWGHEHYVTRAVGHSESGEDDRARRRELQLVGPQTCNRAGSAIDPSERLQIRCMELPPKAPLDGMNSRLRVDQR